LRGYSLGEEWMEDVANCSESTEIRALERKAVEIFAQEMAPTLALEYSSLHFESPGLCRPCAL
jgi:hypothetical protein